MLSAGYVLPGLVRTAELFCVVKALFSSVKAQLRKALHRQGGDLRRSGGAERSLALCCLGVVMHCCGIAVPRSVLLGLRNAEKGVVVRR